MDTNQSKIIAETSAKEFVHSSVTLIREEITASTLDRFFYAVANHLEDSFNEPSAGDLRGAAEWIISGLELDEDCEQVKVKNRLAPGMGWEEAWDELRNSVLVEKPAHLTAEEADHIVRTLDECIAGEGCSMEIDDILRSIKNVGLEKAAEVLRNLAGAE